MAALEIGRVCIKTAGREAGKYCVVLKKLDDTFVLITGPKTLTGVKRRRCNIEHLEPTPYSVKIAAEASEDAVIKAYDAVGLTKRFGLKRPSPEIVKEAMKKIPKVEVEKPKIEVKPERKKKVKPEKPKVEKKVVKPKPEKVEKPKEEKKEKKGITIKLKIPTLRRKKKPKEEKKVVKKPEKKKVEKRKPVKKPKKVVKKKSKKKVKKKKK